MARLCTVTNGLALLILITHLDIDRLLIFTDSVQEGTRRSASPGNNHCCIILFIWIPSAIQKGLYSFLDPFGIQTHAREDTVIPDYLTRTQLLQVMLSLAKICLRGMNAY